MTKHEFLSQLCYVVMAVVASLVYHIYQCSLVAVSVYSGLLCSCVFAGQLLVMLMAVVSVNGWEGGGWVVDAVARCCKLVDIVHSTSGN